MNVTEFGALAFGVVIGWFTYFVNRYREEVTLADVATVIGAIGGGAVLTLFPEESRLFGFYGIGLAIGFFAYFLVLVCLVGRNRKRGWTSEWFLDGRRPPERKGVHAGKSSRGLNDARIDESLDLPSRGNGDSGGRDEGRPGPDPELRRG
ncbi:hypothetical protein AB0C12_33120 [Actinoplanes sp. NPDC048967]|uniref:hypothetical protein n=1 Tax=Actinoplanes sp. NPDC048967 TaxID=3155269 RepID=UPI0033E0F318